MVKISFLYLRTRARTFVYVCFLAHTVGICNPFLRKNDLVYLEAYPDVFRGQS